MTALNDLVRKFKQAVTGIEDAPRATKPFEWEPAPALPALAPVLKEAGPREIAPAQTGAGPSWKRAGAELPSVVGGAIPADVADFATVYKGAAVHAPQHEYGVDRVAGMLEHKSLAGLDRGVKASAVLAALDAAGVVVKDVIHDGLLRYKALVAFEAAKELELHQLRPRNERRIEELKGASEGFQKKKQAEIDALTRESASALASLTRLKAASVSLPQVLKDAALREHALEGFVAAKEREVETLRQRNEGRVAALREEIETYVGEKNSEIEGLKRANDSAGSAFSQLQLRKRQEEERLREVLAHFVVDSENPVPRAPKNAG